MTRKNTSPLEGWKNRHVDGLPTEDCEIDIITNEGEERVNWHPYTPAEYHEFAQPAKGFLGNARRKSGIGWNAWEQNDYEFVYWRAV